MFQRLSLALAQVKAGNTSENYQMCVIKKYITVSRYWNIKRKKYPQ